MEKQNKPLSEKEHRSDIWRASPTEFKESKWFNSDDVKQAVKEAYEKLLFDMHLSLDNANIISRVFKDKFGFDLE